jgi:ribonucleoside-diphosphate reductase alpha chain
MDVYKRNGDKEKVNFEKIHKRIEYLVKEPVPLNEINPSILAQIVIRGLKNNMKTSDIDIYAANVAASHSTNNIEYLQLAARIIVDNHQKNTMDTFSDKVELLYRNKHRGENFPLVSTEFFKFVRRNKSALNSYITYERDFLIDFFGFKTLESGYLINIGDKIIERPQDVFMRVAVQIHIPDPKHYKDPEVLKKILDTYDSISLQYYTHATPTLFNSGTINNNLSSCFLLGTKDSLCGIMNGAKKCAEISASCGGIGLAVSQWRSEGTLIRGTNGYSSGIVPHLRIMNEVARSFNQGAGKRKGSFAIYLEPHHPDLIAFLDLKKAHGDENMRCRDLFTALWVSDLFMKRLKNATTKTKPLPFAEVENAGLWSFFDPSECPDLYDTYGEEFEQTYLKYEQEHKARASMPILDILKHIAESQSEKGVPYILYKDTVNRYSMQKNIGLIRSSNLCAEIQLHADADNFSVCNLSSICLSKYVFDKYSEDELKSESKRKLNHEFPVNPYFDYKKLVDMVGEITENLNNVIDKTWNPVAETARTNFKNRPLGIGIQGLADVFMKFRIPFGSESAKKLNKNIAEAIYYSALCKSTELSKAIYKKIIKEFDEPSGMKDGKEKEIKISLYPHNIIKQFPELKQENKINVFKSKDDVPKDIGAYPTYNLEANGGAPIKHSFHWELYGLKKEDLSGMFDWGTLRNHINLYGVRNSTVTAYMPTASTSQIMSNSQSFEPYLANIFQRRAMAGNFVVINKFLVNDLKESGLWGEEMREYLLATEGSVQHLPEAPKEFKDLYKTMWEIPQRELIDLASDRQPFVDQSQSMNLYIKDFNESKCVSVMLYTWEKKLKTGSYYIRTKPAAEAQKFTINLNAKNISISGKDINTKQGDINEMDDEICLLCGS